nr:pentatricopeptide repeat-containing protein [Quercus suber]
MKSRWIFHNLSSQLPSWVSNLLSPFKTQTHQNPLSEPPKFVLNHADLSLLLSICGKECLLHLGSSIHASIVKKSEFLDLENRVSTRSALVVWNSLLFVYSKCGELSNAVKLFDHMPVKDTVSWNTVMSGFLRNGEFDIGFGLFKRMRDSGLYQFDKATLTTILSACEGPEFCYVFDEMLERNVITWTAVISGLAQNECYEESLELFVKMRYGSVDPNLLTYLSSLMACSGLQTSSEGRQIHGLLWKLGIQSDLCIESALMDMYSKCGSIEDAWKIFESAEELDEVSMTVILVGFAQNGFEEEAIQIFVKIIKSGIEVDPDMVSAVLGAFGVDASLGLGTQIHALVIKKNFSNNTFVINGLINMYSKCGDLEDSIKVFHRMSQRNSVSWNSLIAAFARHGDGSKALEMYDEMRLEGIQPTDVTFLSLLHACSHVGLVERGMELLESMAKDHGLSPRSEHYACIIDLLGRAGLLTEAKQFIARLPENPGIEVWQALLGACSIHGDSEMGKYAADQLFSAAPESPAPYVLLSNIYSSEGRWKERARTIKRMREMGVSKEVGMSWIEIEKKVQSFVVGDKMHAQSGNIYGVLAELFRHMTAEGYAPDKRFIIYYLDQDGKGEPLV